MSFFLFKSSTLTLKIGITSKLNFEVFFPFKTALYVLGNNDVTMKSCSRKVKHVLLRT